MSLETRVKILTSANELFSKNGFAGTSIREISSHSNVNIAAINYHFKSKKNLFHSVLKKNYEYLEQEIKQIFDTETEIETCVLQIFRLFIRHGDKILNSFKFLMDQNTKDLGNDFCTTASGNFGPPGGDIFMNYISEKFPGTSTEDQFFVMKNIFSAICHSALTLSSPGLSKQLNSSEFFNKNAQERNIVKLTSVLTKSIQ